MASRRFLKKDGRSHARLIGRSLKALRERCKISQRRAGEAIFRERTRIYRMEVGHDEARVSELFALLLLYSDAPDEDVVQIFWEYAQAFLGAEAPLTLQPEEDANEEPVSSDEEVAQEG